MFNPFPNNKSLNFSKLKEFAEDNFNFDLNGRMFSKRRENTVEKEKLLVTFSHSVFKRLVLQTRKTRACLGKG